MNSSRLRNGYEEIGHDSDSVSQSVEKRSLHYVLIGGFTICMSALTVVIVLVNTIHSPGISSDIQISDNSEKVYAPAPAPAEATLKNGQLEDVILEIEQGKILGKRMQSRAGREYLAFLGIPYAKPPLGELKFQPPVKAGPWNGTLDATQFKPDCIQKDKYGTLFRTIGSEDCLYINVYTPKTLQTLKSGFDFNRFPVLFYVHGGRQYGSGTRYGAEYFMDEDVILITFHYRLGVLGNLNTNDMEARGNQGLKDQVMALQWVNDNIEKFGGNDKKITMFGNSFGAIHTTSHMLSPMSRGLFQQAILQSGTVLYPLVFVREPMKAVNELATALGFTGNTTKELVTFFRNTDVDKLILTSYLMDFGTSVEPVSDTDDVFLPDTPLNLLQDGHLNQVATIFGVMSGEGLMLSIPLLNNPKDVEAYNENWAINAVPYLELNNSALLKDPERIANAAREFYLGDKKVGRESERNLTALSSDRRFYHPANTFATFQMEKNGRGRDDVFLYYFDYDAPKSYGDANNKEYGATEFLGAGHADELQFLFPYNPFPRVPVESEHYEFSRMMVKFWATFAANGKPSGAKNGTEWLPIGKEKPYQCYEVSKNPKMFEFFGDRMKFWDSFDLTDLYV